jgi:glycosyltransferase involved in cell wall biosynthesis
VRLAVVGPAHPHKGGVVLHTAWLCQELAARGHHVVLVPWTAPYPAWLYPGRLELPGATPEAPAVRVARRGLRWWDPLGWWLAGRRAAGADRVVVVHVVPAHVPALLTVIRAAGDVPVTVVAHNVLPHEAHAGDRALVRRILRRGRPVVVHTAAEQSLACELDPTAAVVVAEIAPHPPVGVRRQPLSPRGPRLRVLVPGTVRPYKGVDILIAALVGATEAELVVAGEVWGDPDQLTATARRLGVADRVQVKPGYVPAAELAELYAAADVVVLPYLSGTASQHVTLAHAFGRTVIASAVGSFPGQIRDGVDGLLVPPGDEAGLAAALRELWQPGVLERLTSGISGGQPDEQWDFYIAAVLGEWP